VDYIQAMTNFFKSLLIQSFAGLVLITGAPAHAQIQSFDRTSAVILAYQRVGENIYPATSISKEQFSENIQELLDGGYHIASLDDIVSAIKADEKLPDRTVAITFNGAYRSILDNAVPLLLSHNLPFTVFFSSDQADGNTPQYMDWNDIRRLNKYPGVTLGLHPASYSRLTDSPPGEIRRQVNKALTRYRQELRGNPAFFAYPFGEYTKTYREIIAASEFKAAFGQQSGVAWSGSDLFALPRFSITESYGDDDRFRMVAMSLPLPVSDIVPDDPHITTNNPPIFGFTLDPALIPKISHLSCFISEQGKPEMLIVGENRVELRVPQPFEDERIRVNCTMPGPAARPGEDLRWRWFGMLLSVSRAADDDEETEDSAPATGPIPN
jgi:peptidoglycan/xylan/chitin deacetylase (PgdA/CDA1 family)